MILVAVVGIAIWYFGPPIVARYRYATIMVRHFDAREKESLEGAKDYAKTKLMLRSRGLDFTPRFDVREQAYSRMQLRRAGYYASLKKKYQRSARYPWLPVERDPPPPE